MTRSWNLLYFELNWTSSIINHKPQTRTNQESTTFLRTERRRRQLHTTAGTKDEDEFV